MRAEPFVPPPYPYDRLDPIKALAAKHDGGVIDLSIGTPFDPPPQAVIDALGSSNAERGYPPSTGTPEFREAAASCLPGREAAAAWLNPEPERMWDYRKSIRVIQDIVGADRMFPLTLDGLTRAISALSKKH